MSFVFFDTLFPKGDDRGRDLGFVAVALYPGGVYRKEDGPTQSHFFAWPSQRDDLTAFCLANSDHDVYVSPALFRTRGSRKGQNIVHQWAAYADADAMPLDRLRVKPTMVVETSEGRHHLYWVTEADDPRQLTDISRTIATDHAGDGCDASGWDAGQLLRVPGTANNKYASPGNPSWRIPQPDMGTTLTLKALAEEYPPFTGVSRPSTADSMPLKADWYYARQSISESAEVFRSSPEAHDMYSAEVRADQDRSRTLWKLLGLLSRLNVSRITAMHIAWSARCNKYRIDGRPEEELWAQLCKAFDSPENQPVRNSFSDLTYRKGADESDANPENKLSAFAESVAILRPEERDLVPRDTFVDRYEQWAASRTDAPACYQRAGAATILSAVLGEFGKCPTTFDTNLTLWFFILGPTTRARKTTAMMMWVDFLDSLSDSSYDYLLGSDTTSEALTVVLADRNGRSSVFYRDEAHGLLYEQSAKRYLAGVRELMTELFSGRVRVSLRVNTMKESEERDLSVIRTNFLMFLCGTVHQVTASLSVSDYQSGHLARFLIAEADPPPVTEESMFSDQFDGQTPSDDVMRTGLLNDMAASRSFWANRTEPGEPVMIPFDDASWKRLQKAKWELYNTADKHELSEVLLPTTARMGDSMMKAAILLAMAEREQVVRMPHLLKAMLLTEEWYRSTSRIAGKILHSAWASRQNEILTAIQTRKEGVTEQDIYARFRVKMQEKDIESDLHVLAKAGLIHKTHERGRIRYIPIVRA